MPTFVARINHSPRFKEAHFQALKQDGKLPEEVTPIVEAHLQYLRGLKAKGKIICAGPVVAFTWGLDVLRADSLEEAKKLIEDDPGVKSGLLTDYKIEPWYHMV